MTIKKVLNLHGTTVTLKKVVPIGYKWDMNSLFYLELKLHTQIFSQVIIVSSNKTVDGAKWQDRVGSLLVHILKS